MITENGTGTKSESRLKTELVGRSWQMRSSRSRRRFSAILLGVVFLMVLVGSSWDGLRSDPTKFSLYWCLVFGLLLWVIALVLVELLAIRLHFVSSRRKIFLDTIGDPALQKKLHDAQQKDKDQTGEQEEQP